MGAGRGNGTTHLAIMLANCCANGCGLRTAAIEYGNHRDYMKICDETRTKTEDIRHFTYNRIVFHICHSSMEVANCLQSGIEAAVIDINGQDDADLEEFIRCDIRILSGAVSLWKLEELRQMTKRLNDTSYILAAAAPDLRQWEALLRHKKQQIFQIPIEANPFCITSDTMYRLRKLLPIRQ